METQITPNNESNLENKEQSWRNQPPCTQTLLQSYNQQNSMALAQKQEYRSIEQDRVQR